MRRRDGSPTTWRTQRSNPTGHIFPDRLFLQLLEDLDLPTQAARLDVPVDLVTGHDRMSGAELVERYGACSRPRKELASFQCSGHPPCLEESERFNRWMVDVVLAEPSRPRKPEHAGAGYQHLRRGVAGRIPRCQRSATLMRSSWAGRLPGRAP
jgi:hypothetical protein